LVWRIAKTRIQKLSNLHQLPNIIFTFFPQFIAKTAVGCQKSAVRNKMAFSTTSAYMICYVRNMAQTFLKTALLTSRDNRL
jgi:hypothetical protein